MRKVQIKHLQHNQNVSDEGLLLVGIKEGDRVHFFSWSQDGG